MTEPSVPPASSPAPDSAYGPPTGEINWRRAGISCGIGAGIVLVCVILAGFMIRSRPEAPRRPRVARQAAAEVVTLKPLSMTPRVVGLGRLRAKRSVALSAQVGGEVVELHPELEDGNVLAAGTVIARLDDRDIQQELAQVRAQIDAQRADLDSLRIERETSERRIAAAQRLLEIARGELARLLDMEGSGVGTPQNVDAARRALVQSEDALIGLEASQRQLGPREARAQATLAEAQSRLKTLELRLERTRIVLPFAGMVTDVGVELHQLVSAPQVVCRLLQIDQLELPVSLTLADASLLAPGLQPGRTQALVSRTVNGRRSEWAANLSRFEPVDPDTQTITAVLVLEPREDEPGLTPGLFCEVHLSGPPLEPAIVLPRSAVQERSRVYLVEDGVLRIVPIEVGAQVGDWLEVRAGLSAGQEVVISALDGALDGTAVEVTRTVEPRVP
ncbi:MAG: efflux RND transporter periplasmic adaptor subunit [Planctomycetes bacterium]|nr:efflux RND transporter periplasmic adaptor subunit [Planctomycetota bacterium]